MILYLEPLGALNMVCPSFRAEQALSAYRTRGLSCQHREMSQTRWSVFGGRYVGIIGDRRIINSGLLLGALLWQARREDYELCIVLTKAN